MDAGNIAKKVIGRALRSVRLASAWSCRFFKIRFHKCRLCKLQKELDGRMCRLGAEIYALFKQGETEFLKSLVVKQQLKIVEEAESHVFAVHDRIEEIEERYRGKKEELAAGETSSDQSA